ncbi:MAG TPA: DNA ligase D, partial [Planctomycetota bacterium]|nr:DNA ligase D [Planctomycetota bacterium]
MTLREYRRKRDFRRTPEPRGGRGAKTARGQRATRAPSGLSFVIQKHAASRLHYDFRLEMEGVLRSWAVPKGPSLDPAQRRLAAHVEDHPIEYGGFEGIIPRGEYGGGTVLLWDRGTWTPLGDPVASYRAGKLKFRLDGEKLRGGWTLVRMGGRAADGGKNWLLIKERDGDARPGGREIVDAKPKSVATGRSIEQIAKASDRVWHSKESGNGEAKRVKKPAVVPAAARRAALPRTFSPQLATLVAEAPDGDEWLHEIKLDGYRIVARLENGRARLLSRSGKDWTARLPTIARAVEKLRARSALLDGEVVALLPDGTSSFQALQNALSEGGEPELVYYVFDLVHLDGRSLAALAQEERKTALASLLGSSPPRPIRYSDHGVGHGAEFKRHACRLALEGIVSKRRDAPYHSGRGRDWLKTKCIHEQELVIGGFTAPSGARTGFGSLLLGVHDRDGHLRYAGHVGTGFTAASLAELRRKLEGLEQRETPFASPPREAYGRGVKWVKPELVAAVEFTEWTRDGQLRHPSFQGLREDKPAREVVREEAERMDEIEDDPKRERPKTKRAPRAKAPSASAESVGGARLTHPDRVLYPDAGITKRALAEYYVAVADRMLPHVAGRPLTIVRCPEGQTGECFYQKHAGDSAPASLRRIPIREEGKAATYLALDGV